MATDPPWWHEHNYLNGKPIGDDLWIVVMPMIFTFRVAVCTPDIVHEFYCYEKYSDAFKAYLQWDGTGPSPVEGWTRHHAR